MGVEDKLGIPSRTPQVSPSKNPAYDDELTVLRRKRGNLKGRLTQFQKYLDSFQDSCPSKLQVREIKFRLQAAQDHFKTFNEIQTKIELVSSDSDIDSNNEYIESYENLYFSVLAIAQDLVESEETENKGSNNSKSNGFRSLPKIKLPTFSGKFDDWLEFKHAYVTMIHNCSDLDEIQKFHYLRSSLTGTALEVISSFEFTPENYAHAWELLENRFHNTRLLVQNHIKALFNMTLLKQESSSQIRKLIDTVLRNIRSLTSLGEPTQSWDTLIIYLVQSKLDSTTEREWEIEKGTIHVDSDRKLKLDDILSFLKKRADMLDSISSNQNKPQNKSQNASAIESKGTSQKRNAAHCYASTSSSVTKNIPRNKVDKCYLCNGAHAIYACFKFLNLSIPDRIKIVDEKQLCRNCLRFGHSLTDCIFGPCKQCQQKHNSLLHLASGSIDEPSADRSTSQAESLSAALHSLSIGTYHGSVDECAGTLQPVLLSTALVEVADNNKRFHTARALLDSGSQHCFISDKLQKRINAPLIQSTIHISGVAQSVTQTNHSCELLMRSKLNDYSSKVKCFVLQRITSSLPTTYIDTEHIRIPDNVSLADPTFNIPSEIDLLIGADLFWELLDGNRIRLVNGPFLQNSKLGWLLSGPINTQKNFDGNGHHIHCNFNQTLGLNDQLKRFWEIENVPQVDNILTKDEQFCEDIFTSTTKRESEGRFSVRIPLKESPDVLGDSYNSAKNRFLSLERKLERLPDYKRMYSDFMSEYLALSHMSRIDKVNEPNYFLPHHGVFRENSSTTKLRVVFDASAVTTSNKSLNDIQCPGPALQNDIFSILLRFRQYKYVACADVEKMFRQILIQPDQRPLQLVLWREKPVDPLRIYQLNTVTYGTASAPYLSMRCIRQLALECEDDVIAKVIKQDFFVDDLCTGHDDYQELLAICEKISQVLQSGCFPLRKWTFNADVTKAASVHTFVGEHTQNKTLGIGWQSDCDELYFTTKIDCISESTTKLTKRVMLSIISQIYDPLGLLSPAVIIAKIFIQKLWLDKMGWDSPVSQDLAVTWNNFLDSLGCLQKIRIPRHVISNDAQHKELHIFTDASQNAYGSCAYIRSYHDISTVTVRLLCAKSKVAPLKSLSIPRLELCGALVGARLYKKIIDSLRLKFNRIFFWTDSTIVMGWLRMSPHLLKTFVQNRVAEINELTNDADWLHVSGTNNPADLLSRGLPLDSLIDSSLWWNGPSYLQENIHDFSNNELRNESINLNNLPELKSQSINLTSTCSKDLIQFEKYSSFIKLKRIVAYVLRFISRLRPRRSKQETGPLTAVELSASQVTLVKLAQAQSFPDVYIKLLNNIQINTNSKHTNCISGLNILLDQDKLIRVGGRLSNSSEFSYEKKHPILLCSKHHLTKLIVRSEHERLLHCGPQLLLSTLRECWWPLSARNLVRKIVRECVTCARIKGKTLKPIMGNLPPERLDSGFPFVRTGMDLGGPFYVLNKKGRGARLTKSYICLFVCFLTRAVHLELVSSLSTEDFILALKRFISRRGKPESIYSDNGKNFVGAEREFYTILNSNSKQIIDYATNNGIKFNFIPPYSPHFGGLWESGIRSCKYHLRRVVGNANLTYEELSTVLAQIESVLNSRPMSPLSTDPDDYNPLTPGHFLIGRPLTAPAHDDLTDVQTSRLSRYHRIEQLRQHFWQRWAKEYISELQIRTKWKSHQNDIELESLVLIKEDNLPPLKWRLGRVMKTFPGTDGVSRVAEIRTATGTIRRAFSKICPLPLEPIQREDVKQDTSFVGRDASKAGGMSTHSAI